MISKERLEQLHEAARIIEYDAEEGIESAITLVGEETAVALLIAQKRVALNPDPHSWPPPPNLKETVDEHLRTLGLV